MAPADAERLREVFRRESRSLLRYARDAAPYTPAGDRDILVAVKRIADEAAAAVGALGETLDARAISRPHLGAFPVAFTDLNFVAVRFLLAKLVAAQMSAVATLEADAAAVEDTAARVEVVRLLEVSRRHLKELEAIE